MAEAVSTSSGAPGIPPFKPCRPDYPHALLPEGVFPTSLEALRERFVIAYPSSASRDSIFDGLEELLELLKRITPRFTAWIDGSFVEDKMNPADVDLIVFFEANALEGLDSNERNLLRHLVSPAGHEEVKRRFSCDLYVAPWPDTSHPTFSQHDRWRRYWRHQFGTTRPLPPMLDKTGHEVAPEIPGYSKGIVEIRGPDGIEVPHGSEPS